MLHWNGTELWDIPLPYGILQALFPPLQLYGVPVRMIVMSTLALAVISAFGFSFLSKGNGRHRAVAAVLLAGIAVESLPPPIPTLPIKVPAYVVALKNLAYGAVLDSLALDHVVYQDQDIIIFDLAEPPCSLQ